MNIARIVEALEPGRNPWYFPTAGEYAQVLEQHGFEIQALWTIERWEKLEHPERGLREWLENVRYRGLRRHSHENRIASATDLIPQQPLVGRLPPPAHNRPAHPLNRHARHPRNSQRIRFLRHPRFKCIEI